MLIIEPFGGLANRMRVIVSGLWLSDQLCQELKVIWNNNSELYCSFEDLFQPIAGMKIIKKKVKYKYLKSTNQSNWVRKIIAFLINNFIGIDLCIKEADFKRYIWNKKIDLLEVSKGKKEIYIHTCEEFGDNSKEFSKFFPLPELQYIIDQNCNKFNDKTIGIHIRRGDHYESIRKSRLDLFIKEIELRIQENDNLFFLATDDDEVLYELRNRFHEKILFNSRVLNRNTKKGIIGALIDLYCLSKTTYIYGSYRSSFSDIAARLGNIESKILADEN